MVLCEIKCYRTIAETNNIENQEYLEKGVGLVRIYLLREGDWVDRYNRYGCPRRLRVARQRGR
jgi:hypothetical protein